MNVLGYYEFTIKIIYKLLIENETISKFMHNYKESQHSDKNFFQKLFCSRSISDKIIWSTKHKRRELSIALIKIMN